MIKRIIATQPNTFPDVALFQRHILPLPSCCPVSGNPQPGSEITIVYRATEKFLEVYSLRKYIDSYIDGHPSGVRDMEGMIQQIAQDCSIAVKTYVRVDATIILQNKDRMHLTAKARPPKNGEIDYDA